MRSINAVLRLAAAARVLRGNCFHTTFTGESGRRSRKPQQRFMRWDSPPPQSEPPFSSRWGRGLLWWRNASALLPLVSVRIKAPPPRGCSLSDNLDKLSRAVLCAPKQPIRAEVYLANCLTLPVIFKGRVFVFFSLPEFSFYRVSCQSPWVIQLAVLYLPSSEIFCLTHCFSSFFSVSCSLPSTLMISVRPQGSGCLETAGVLLLCCFNAVFIYV